MSYSEWLRLHDHSQCTSEHDSLNPDDVADTVRLAEEAGVMVLPGTPGPTLEGLLESLSPRERAAVKAHLLGGTSAEWLSLVLTNHGHRISATTIQRYRRSLPVPTREVANNLARGYA